MVRTAGDDERDMRIRQYLGAAKESARYRVLPPGGRIRLRGRIVGHCAGRRPVVLLYDHVSSIALWATSRISLEEEAQFGRHS